MNKNSQDKFRPSAVDLATLLINTGVEKYQKEGLSSLCQALQRKQLLSLSPGLLNSIRGLLFCGYVEVERWALKVIAELGTRPDLGCLILRKINENPQDPENYTWAIGALLSISTESEIQSYLSDGTIPKTPFYRAVAHMFCGEEIASLFPIDTVNLDKETSLTLKWLCLMVGLDRANPDLFDPKFENFDMMGNLVGHDNNMVAQYAFWGLHQNPKGTIQHVNMEPFCFCDLPDNVRNWAYQLLTKDRQFTKSTMKTFDMATWDKSIVAKKGLAKGIKGVWHPDLPNIMLKWNERETDPDVKASILEHFTSQASFSTAYEDVAQRAFKNIDGGIPSLRARLKACAEGSSLYSKFKRIEIEEEGGGLLTLLDDSSPKIITLNTSMPSTMKREEAKKATWVVETGMEQGTAFFVKSLGIVTCWHCTGQNMVIYHPDNVGKKYTVTLLKGSEDYDLAILRFPDNLENTVPSLTLGEPKEEVDAILMGYPNFSPGQTIRVEDGKVIRKFPRSARELIEITCKIIEGNSGGPVLNMNYEVIGIASQGINKKVNMNQAEFIAISVKELSKLK